MTDIEVNTTWSSLERRAQMLLRRRMEVEARRASEANRNKTLLAQALSAQARLDAADSVHEILEDVQRQAHEHAVGAYEQMLSALLADVLPGEREVVLDLHADRGVSGMDVFIRKGEDQPLEDAWLGTGGSVTNLLSTGLRLVALMRSGRRRFMVLDESDCWIKPELVGRYAGVVAQMSAELRVQVLMISHHEESLFANHIPYRLNMSALGSSVVVEWTAESEVPTWDTDDEGVRSIGLFDFQSHQNTIVPLAPGVTLLQGDNDIGKSAVVNALRAVFDGNSNDTMIRHHTPKARVEIDLGASLLTWVRNRKGKVKVSYDLTDTHTREVIHSSVGTQPPEWLMANVGIGKVDELDIQIGQQQDPVFLLNQPASKRAKALAVGQESGHIQAMMALDRQEQQAARSTLKQCEQEIEALRMAELASRALEQTPGPDEAIVAHAKRRADTQTQAKTLLDDWKQSVIVVSAGKISTKRPTLPTLHGKQSTQLLGLWSGLVQKVEIVSALEVGSTPQQLPTDKAKPLTELAVKWKSFMDVVRTCTHLRSITPPKSPPTPQAPAISGLSRSWEKANLNRGILSVLIDVLPPKPPTVGDGLGASIRNRWKPISVRYSALLMIKKKALDASVPQQHASNMDQKRIQWIEAVKEVEQINRDLQSIETTEKQVKHELTIAFPVCPTCGQDMPEHSHV